MDTYVIVTKEHFDAFLPPEWYSIQTVLAWRASLAIPLDLIVLVHDEHVKAQPVSEKITDVIRVNLEVNREHWTLVYLSIKEWTTTYYDSYFGVGPRWEDHQNMTKNCTKLVTDMASEHGKIKSILSDRNFRILAEVNQTDLVVEGKLV